VPDTAVITQLNNVGTPQVANLRWDFLFNLGSEDRNLQRCATPEFLCREQVVHLNCPGTGRRIVLGRPIGPRLHKAERQRSMLREERRTSQENENERG